MNAEPASRVEEVASLPDNIGSLVKDFPVEISTRFLKHFSEQLYSSPQKAFEELISNGWDAGADYVDIHISDDLEDPSAAMAVLDNGASMDVPGLELLWKIAFSPKTNEPVKYGRQVIGKFGIGKLATYVLANKLTYVCKSADGVIRRVTMNYGELDNQEGAELDKLVSDLRLEIYEVQEAEIKEALENVDGGAHIYELIRSGVPRPDDALGDDEFGYYTEQYQKPADDCWTLAILSDLKPAGKELKIGILRRMLMAALPIGGEMAIMLNGQLLTSSKIDAPKVEEWTIGPDIGFDFIELESEDQGQMYFDIESDAAINDTQDIDSQTDGNGETITLTFGTSPYPYVEIPEIGKITGSVSLFEDKISGVKSDERGASNGFHVNVLGRVVNQKNESFGEKNLSHAAWARFRMAVRADGLNAFLTTNREQFRECRELRIFRAFLRKVFNKARTKYDSDHQATMPDGGDVLVRSLGVVSLNPLRSVISEALKFESPISGLIDESGIGDREEKQKSWEESTSEDIGNALGEIKYEKCADEGFVRFRLSDNAIIVNRDHPFAMEHSRTKSEKELVRTVGMVNLLADMHALYIGVDPSLLESNRAYRDLLMRFKAMQQRDSGVHIAKLLLKHQHDSANHKRLEVLVSDALIHLGFDVKDMAKSGEPEGVAKAYPLPTFGDPTTGEPNPPLYSFAFDAKSSKHVHVQTNNINLAAIVEHRTQNKTDYSLVVAPGFPDGTLPSQCTEQKVTPMLASDLAKLLIYTVEYGAIPLTEFQEVFDLYDPSHVSSWVADLERRLKDSRSLTYDIFMSALDNLSGKIPDKLQAATIAYECRENLGAAAVKDVDIHAIAHGLSVLVPNLVGIQGDDIIVNVSAEKLRDAVAKQLEQFRTDVSDRS